MSAEVIVAVNWVEETKVVTLPDPFHSATEFETKLVPFRVKVKLFPPAVVEVGEMELSVGAGLLTVTAVLKAEVTPADVAQTWIACP